MSIDLQKFIDDLDGLEPSSKQLQQDPDGHSWLPPHLQNTIKQDHACRCVFLRYVACEMALYEGSTVPSDVFFTAKVIAQLSKNSDSTVLLRQRFWILSLFYSFALGLTAYLLLTLRDELVIDRRLLHEIADFGAAWGGQMLIIVGVISIFLPVSLAISWRRVVSRTG